MNDLAVGRLRVQHWNARGSLPSRWHREGPWPTMSGGRILRLQLGYQAWDIVWSGR